MLVPPGVLEQAGGVPSTLLDGLISWWELDEASGARVDAHGALSLASNGVGSDTGHVHALAAEFIADADGNGTTDLNRSAAEYTASTGTCAFWMKPTRIANSGQIFIVHVGDAFTGDLEIWQIDNSVNIKLNGDATPINVSGITTGWHLIVGDWTTTLTHIYRDGVEGSIDAPDTYTGVTGNGTFTLGQQWTGETNSYSGLLGPLMYWNRVLTSDERTELYNGGAGIGYPG